MADDRYTRTDRAGKPDPKGGYDKYTIFNLRAVEAVLGFVLWIVQAGYSTGVAASGGTHAGAGSLDISIRGMSLATINRVVKALRKQGFAAWYRPYNWDNRGGGAHIHAVLIGNANASATAKAQWGAFRRFLNGLANGATDRFWHPAKIVNAPYKTYRIRFATWNLPGPDKLKGAAARIAGAVKLVKAGKLHFVGWNELEGIKRAHVASTFASNLDAALGAGWNLIKPTLAFNENYISYQTKLLALVKQYPDRVLTGATGGRHLTRVVFEDKANGFIFAVGQYHLVNDGGAAGERDRQSQARQALRAMQEISQAHDDCPFILQGDANTHRALDALQKMKRTRVKADTSKTRNVVTFTTEKATQPSTDSKWVIDQQHVTAAFYVVGYSVRWVLTAGGKFRKPRASDHALVVTSVTHT